MIRRFLRLWGAFRDDAQGLAALEFALIAPLMAGLLLAGADGWLRISQHNDMRTALHSGARYYQAGGSDDAAANSLAMAIWASRPSDGTLQVTRSCACGAAPIVCSALCSGSNPPAAYVTLTASGTFDGVLNSRRLSDSEVIRVR